MLAVYLMMIKDDKGKTVFENVYRTYGEKFLFLALSKVTNKEDAEDVVQDAFRSLIVYIDCKSPTVEQAKNFMFSMIRFRAVDLLRSRERDERHRADVEVENCSTPDHLPEKELIIHTDIETVVHCIEALSREDQTVLRLRIFEELDFREIAQILKIKKDTAKKRFERAKKRLLIELGKEGGEP